MPKASSPDILATNPRPCSRSIALVGMMGVGKTTVGRRLAKALDLPFFDSDEEIETASNRTVTGYFRDHGEDAFRDGERRVIERLLSGPPVLLATGGGAFIQRETRHVIKTGAITVWLKANQRTIMSRVAKKDTRPLLNVDDPEAVIKELIRKRYPIYGKADITVNVNNGPHKRAVETILRALDTHLAPTEEQTR